MDNILHLLGIARKGGYLEIGEEPVGAAVRACQAKLILTAVDGAANSLRRAAHFAQMGRIPCLATVYTKGELGRAVGRSACTMAAITDAGLALSVAQKLERHMPSCCKEAVQQLKIQADRELQQQKERQAQERKQQKRVQKSWVLPSEQSRRRASVKRDAQPSAFVSKGRPSMKRWP